MNEIIRKDFDDKNLKKKFIKIYLMTKRFYQKIFMRNDINFSMKNSS